MSDNNSFNVVFNGGGGSGGGGGTINSGSNVGSGDVEVFKQVAGSDLEFRTIINSDSVNLDYYDEDTIQADVNLGVIGIRISDGWYNFYRSLKQAMDNATSGDTIVFFADYIEENDANVVRLKDGVNVNLNGYSYTFNIDKRANAFDTDSTSDLSCIFRNGTIIRVGGSQGAVTNGVLFYLKGNTGYAIDIDFTNCILINSGGVVITTSGDNSLSVLRGGTIIGGGVIDDGVNPPIYLSSYFNDFGTLYNMTFRVDEAVYLLNGCKATNLTIYNEQTISNTGAIVVDSCVMSNCFIKSLFQNSITDGTINNCTFISTIDATLECISTELQNCTIEYVTDGVGASGEALLIDGGTISNCVVTSNVLSSIDATNCFILNSSIITSGDEYVVIDNGGNTFTNCTISNTNDSTTGNLGGIYVEGGGSTIANNSFYIGDSTSFVIAGVVGASAFVLSNVYQGTGNFIQSNVSNDQSATTDTFGNIEVG